MELSLFGLIMWALPLLWFVGGLYALYNVVMSDREIVSKALWAAFILIMPFIGLVSWALWGPRAETPW